MGDGTPIVFQCVSSWPVAFLESPETQTQTRDSKDLTMPWARDGAARAYYNVTTNLGPQNALRKKVLRAWPSFPVLIPDR